MFPNGKHLQKSSSPDLADSSDQWWQLFDTKTKRFYYYNVLRQTTCWSKPQSLKNATSPDNNVLCLLASKILASLIKNLSLNDNLDSVINELKLKLDRSDQNLDKDLSLLSNLLTNSGSDLNSTEFKNSFSSFLSSHSLVSSSSFCADSAQKRPVQPRTNPNYINVDLIDSQNGSLLKNTYVKVQEINNVNSFNKKASSENVAGRRNFFYKKMNSRAKLCSSTSSLNNCSSFELSQVTILLIALLSSEEAGKGDDDVEKEIELKVNRAKFKNFKSESSDSANTLCDIEGSVKKNRSSLKLDSKNFSVSSFFLADDEKIRNQDNLEENVNSTKITKITKIPVSSSLTRKNMENMEKKICFATTTLNDNTSKIEVNPPKIDKKHKETLNRLLANHININSKVLTSQNTNSTKPSQHDDSLLFDASSISIDENPGLNYSYSPSTTSLADLNNLTSQHKHLQFNQRLKNLRRSFNSRTSNETCKPKTQCSFSETKKSDKTATSLSYMLTCGETVQHSNLPTTTSSNRFISKTNFDIENFSPLLARKPSETNLLFIKKNQIDLNVHHERLKTGFLFFSSRKKIPDQDLMVWTNQTIHKPLIKTNNKIIKKEACELFKLIQIYMGDRKMLLGMSNQELKSSKPAKISSAYFNDAFYLQQLNSSTSNDLVCQDIMTKGWMHAQLRDELYLQIVKQTTSNLSKQSSLLGWQLMAICLSFFPPTQKLYPFLNEYILSHTQFEENDEKYLYFNNFNNFNNLKNFSNFSNPQSASSTLSKFNKQTSETENIDQEFLVKLAKACLRRLEKIHITGAKKGLKNPTIEEIILSKSTILNPSLFGTTLEEIMVVQRKKCPDLQLPWIQTVLSEAVLRLNGAKTEGIFRVPGDLDEVNNIKVRFDQLWCSEQVLLKNIESDIIENITDPHLPASLLKLWYRELYEPLIPNEYYDECIMFCDQPDKCLNVIQKLPEINRLVFTYLIKFLKVFADCGNVAVTKMDANNLSMVMAPNCLRCKSNDPKTIMENTKKEMQFIKTLIQHLDTSIVQDIL